jgi:hypothetical protein
MRKKMSNGFSPNEYEKIVNPKDPNDIAILFEDLEIIIGCPIEKAFSKYKEAKVGGFIY